jgi:hypothetical protein
MADRFMADRFMADGFLADGMVRSAMARGAMDSRASIVARARSRRGTRYRRSAADVARATAASGTHTAANTSVPATPAAGMPAAKSMPATPAPGMTPAATGVTTAARMAAAAFRRSRVGRSRQRCRKDKNGNPEFKFRHDFARSVLRLLEAEHAARMPADL